MTDWTSAWPTGLRLDRLDFGLAKAGGSGNVNDVGRSGHRSEREPLRTALKCAREAGSTQELNIQQADRDQGGCEGRQRRTEQNPIRRAAYRSTPPAPKTIKTKAPTRVWCEVPMRVRARKASEASDQASHACPWRMRSAGVARRIIAKHYGRRCDEGEHGLTRPILRSAHDPERQRRMMQAREYWLIPTEVGMGLWIRLAC